MEVRLTNPILPNLLVWALLILVPGCASLPDFKRVEGATDAMAHYSGVMAGGIPAVAHSMTRISHTADGVRRKTDRELDAVSKATYKVEPSVQTYLDSKRGGTDNLKGIHQELRELRETLRGIPALPYT
jgi:hypothetical protein